MRPMALATLALALASALFILVLVLRRTWLVRQRRRREALAERLRPVAVVLVESEAEGGLPELQGPEAEVFAELLSGYSRLLRGDPRERIAAYFEASGAVAEEIELLRSRRAWRRATAAFSLGDMCSPRTAPDLVRMLDDRVREVRMAAARSLGRLGAVDAIERLVAAGVSGDVPRDVASLALLDIGPAAVPSLLELTAHDEPQIRANAVELIGLLGTAGDSDGLVGRLRDPAAGVRTAAAGALGRLGAGQARDALVRALDDRVPNVRVAAARALGQIGGQRAIDSLLRVARTDSFEPARAASDALAWIDPALVIRCAAEPDAGPHLLEAADLASL
jgi:HEAT repeat protein